MAGRWWVAVAAVVAASCDGSKPPTGPSGGGARITLVAPHPTLAVGESQQLAVVITGSDGVGHAPEGPIAWSSSDEAIYAVWNGGLAVAIAPGQATITAVADGRTAQTTLRAEGGAGGPRHVQGRVTDFASSAGLAGVPVDFVADGTGPRFQTTTDANGGYVIDLPAGRLGVRVDGQVAGELAIHVGGPAYRGDLLGHAAEHCKSRYGVVTDAVTFRPVEGASIRLGSGRAVTGADGWYRMDYGCVYDPYNNTGTALVYASHPAYRDFSQVVGRGILWVNRLDIELQRP
jgi:hypothetical protein